MSQIRYLVGYRPHERGQDALSLAITLAQSFGVALDLVFVVREHSAFAPAYPPVGREEPLIAAQAQEWLDEAVATVPRGIEVATHVRYAPSIAEGLLSTADELGSGLVVIGSGSTGLVRRHELGAVATTMLHQSSRPVCLVPRGYRASGPIEHIDCAAGLRPGGQELIDEAVEVAARRDLPLRVITMVDIDIDSVEDVPEDSPLHAAVAADAPAGSGEVTVDASGEAAVDPGGSGATDDPVDLVRAYVDGLIERAVATHGHPASTHLVIARGGIRDAVASVPWDDSSILLVGSSRLAQPRRFFLGSTAHAMLRVLTVPVVAVPPGAHLDGPSAQEES